MALRPCGRACRRVLRVLLTSVRAKGLLKIVTRLKIAQRFQHAGDNS